jgi:hypothetical protein
MTDFFRVVKYSEGLTMTAKELYEGTAVSLDDVATSNQPFVSAGLAGASVADYNHRVIVTREAPTYDGT